MMIFAVLLFDGDVRIDDSGGSREKNRDKLVVVAPNINTDICLHISVTDQIGANFN